MPMLFSSAALLSRSCGYAGAVRDVAGVSATVPSDLPLSLLTRIPCSSVQMLPRLRQIYWSDVPLAELAGAAYTSSAGFRSKKPAGLSQNATVSTGMTGHSSGRGMW